jgi:hypothetical protein
MITQIIKKITQIELAVVLVLIFGFKSISLAEEVSGEISGISKDSISIVYSRDEARGVESEILLPLNNETKLERVKNLADLNIGDTVTVSYKKTKETTEEGKQIIQIKTEKIKFVRPAQIRPETEVLEPETEISISE